MVRGIALSAGLGALAGAFEAVGLAATLREPVGAVGFAVVALFTTASMTAFATVLAVPIGFAVHARSRGRDPIRAIADQGGAVAVGCGAWYLWEGAWILAEQGRYGGVALFAGMPLFLGPIVSFNARYWLRRANDAPVGWPVVSGAAALGLAALATALFVGRGAGGGGGALAGDPDVVVIAAPARVARDAMVALKDVPGPWVRFDRAVTPSTSARASTAAALTGLHPLRASVLSDDDPLDVGHRTIAEVFQDEGYVTAAFVGAATSRDAGFDQGFGVFDARPPGLAGWVGATSFGRRLGSRRSDRPSNATVDAALGWMVGHDDAPRFLWIDAREVPDVARVIDAVAQSDGGDDAVVAVVGLGDGSAGLGDDAVRAPIALRLPGAAVTVPTPTQQVRTYDLPASLLDAARIGELPVTEGLPLGGYASGSRTADLPVVVLGVDGGGHALVGVRSGGVCYQVDVVTDTERLWRCDDPTERDIGPEQANTLDSARGIVVPDVLAVKQRLGRP
jgi:hypothetical protein